jgi:hypothetical protein
VDLRARRIRTANLAEIPPQIQDSLNLIMEMYNPPSKKPWQVVKKAVRITLVNHYQLKSVYIKCITRSMNLRNTKVCILNNSMYVRTRYSLKIFAGEALGERSRGASWKHFVGLSERGL